MGAAKKGKSENEESLKIDKSEEEQKASDNQISVGYLGT